MVKIFILYASCGSGHFKAAEAIYDYFKEEYPKEDLKLLDVLEYSDPFFKEIYVRGYVFLVNHCHWLWALFFYLTLPKIFQPFIRPLNIFIGRLNTRRFARLLIKEDPAYIISTHFFPSEIATDLKRKQKIDSKIITVMTDFGLHPFWVNPQTDIYVVPSDFTKSELILQGVAEERIQVLGLPVNKKFLKAEDKEVLAQKFNLDKDKFTVLILTGSFGIGPIEEIVDLIYKDTQILVVCGRNRKLFQRLRNKNYPHVSVFGFIDNIEELMSVANLIITKPGGLSLAELLVKELVPVFISAIPGQEIENIRALRNYGIGMNIKDIHKIRDIVSEYCAHPERMEAVKKNIRRLKKPSVLKDLSCVIR